jgi:hypothetical protein
MDCITQTLNSNPPWFRNSVSYTCESLTVLKHVELRSVAFSASRRHGIRVVKTDKHSFVDVIVHDYRSECLTITVLTNEDICACFRKYGFDLNVCAPRYILNSQLFEAMYGTAVAAALRQMPWPA